MPPVTSSSPSDVIAADPEVRRLIDELDALAARRAHCVRALNRRLSQLRADTVPPVPQDLFKVQFDDCRALSSGERWALIDECYRVEDDDEMDLVPNLRHEYEALLTEFELKMGDEFPRMVLMRLVQSYRWIKTFQRRFAQHGAVVSLEDARRIVNKFVYKSARLVEDDMVYVLECRTRGIEFKLAQILSRHQDTSNIPTKTTQRSHTTVIRSSAFRPIDSVNMR